MSTAIRIPARAFVLIAALLVALVMSGVLLATPAHASNQDDLGAWVNVERNKSGLASLPTKAQLNSAAQREAARQAAADSPAGQADLSTSAPSGWTDFQQLSATGTGQSPSTIAHTWATGANAGTIKAKGWTDFGVGYAVSKSGTAYAVAAFATYPAPVAAAPVQAAPAPASERELPAPVQAAHTPAPVQQAPAPAVTKAPAPEVTKAPAPAPTPVQAAPKVTPKPTPKATPKVTVKPTSKATPKKATPTTKVTPTPTSSANASATATSTATSTPTPVVAATSSDDDQTPQSRVGSISSGIGAGVLLLGGVGAQIRLRQLRALLPARSLLR